MTGHLDLPVDERARAALAERGLELRLVHGVDTEATDAWDQAVARGFLDPELTPAQLQGLRERGADQRRVGVYDPSGPDPDRPVGTIAAWPTEVTAPGGGTVGSWAITNVTVAPTHRRRGIARAMMEGELRTAVALGLPMASLTVTESTIYGRYGFGPAADSASWRLDLTRAGWIGPEPGGRLDFVPRERLHALAPALHDRARRQWPGEIAVPVAHWSGVAGIRPEASHGAAVRAVQYTAPDGVVRGLLAYTVRENPDDFSRSSARVSHLIADGPEAYAALWRFLVELDSVVELRASELSVDEPLRWMIADQRAATITTREHHYLRLLDVPAALCARAYGAEGTLALEVDDPQGVAGGRWVVRTGAHGAEVAPWADAEAPAGAIVVRLGVAALSSAYLGSVSLATLAAAGRASASDPAAAARVLGWHVPARLSIWY